MTTGEEKKKYLGKTISRILEQHMNEREMLIEKNLHFVELLDGKKEEYSYIINPINVKGDVVGLVIILSQEEAMSDTDEKIAVVMSDFLSKHIEE